MAKTSEFMPGRRDLFKHAAIAAVGVAAGRLPYCAGAADAGRQHQSVLSRLQDLQVPDVGRHHQWRDRRTGSAVAAAARRAAVAYQLETHRAGSRENLYGRGDRSSWLRRQQQAGGQAGSFAVFQAQHGARSGGGDEESGLRLVPARRSRPRWTRVASARSRSSQSR